MSKSPFRLTHIRPDGSRDQVVVEGRLVVGREMLGGAAVEDRYISGRHAAFEVVGDELQVKDLDSTNGTFLKLEGELELRSGDVFAVGRQLFRFLA